MAAFQSQSTHSSSTLSTEQRQLIEETLAELDPDQLTEADAPSIVETFAQAGIQPGREIASVVSSAGFDAQKIGDMAGVARSQQRGAPEGACST